MGVNLGKLFVLIGKVKGKKVGVSSNGCYCLLVGIIEGEGIGMCCMVMLLLVGWMEMDWKGLLLLVVWYMGGWGVRRGGCFR